MLQITSIYLLKVIAVSGLLFMYYIAALRNKKFHHYNRFCLLMTVAVSACLPLLHLNWFTFKNNYAQTIHLFKIIKASGEEDNVSTGYSILNLQHIALYILMAISFSMLVFLCIRIKNIYRLKKKFPIQQLPGFDFINTDVSSAPFSFLKNIFWRNDIKLDDETGRQILQHEIEHIKQKHSWDKLFIQLVLCFYWMNPFYHLLKKELYLIHEFIADEKAVEQSDANAFARMLLTSQFGNFKFLPAQSIFYSSIKRRLVMLTTSNKTQFSYLRRLMVLPLAVIVVCLFAFTVKNETDALSNKNIIADKPFVLVVDAGHGGKDYGATANGLYEKDIALKIAQKIKSLAPQYGIDIVLTRNADVFMSPLEKSNFANTQNANAFISIHVNSDGKRQSEKLGFEVVVSKDNAQEFSSVLFGSAIIQSLQTNFNITPELQQKQVGIWVLKNSIVPCALIECGYINNIDDVKLLKNNAKIELMAKEILTGAALYANNKNSITPKNTNHSNSDTSVPAQSNSMEQKREMPLYVLDGKIVSKSVADKINPEKIESMYVLKDKQATDKYGEKGKNGVIEIFSKNSKADKSFVPPPPPPPPPTSDL